MIFTEVLRNLGIDGIGLVAGVGHDGLDRRMAGRWKILGIDGQLARDPEAARNLYTEPDNPWSRNRLNREPKTKPIGFAISDRSSTSAGTNQRILRGRMRGAP